MPITYTYPKDRTLMQPVLQALFPGPQKRQARAVAGNLSGGAMSGLDRDDHGARHEAAPTEVEGL
jgi:hypothetical protein